MPRDYLARERPVVERTVQVHVQRACLRIVDACDEIPIVALDYREKAPGSANRNMYIEADGTANTDKSQYGHLASGVPGTVAGIFESHRYGKLPMAKLIKPAIELAEKGFVITAREASGLNGLQDELKKIQYSNSGFCKRFSMERRRYTHPA